MSGRATADDHGPTRILVADDHEVVRRGVRSLLDGGRWQICGEALNGREAVEMALRLRPEIAILDISMPELNGLDATRRIHEQAPEIEILVLTMHESEAVARDIVAAGARGFVLKSEAASSLVAAVEALHRHEPFLPSRVAPPLVVEPDAASPVLTVREREIVQLLSEGHSSREVAARLGITVKTADTHRTNIMRKLGLHSVTALVRYAIRNRIVQP